MDDQAARRRVPGRRKVTSRPLSGTWSRWRPRNPPLCADGIPGVEKIETPDVATAPRHEATDGDAAELACKLSPADGLAALRRRQQHRGRCRTLRAEGAGAGRFARGRGVDRYLKPGLPKLKRLKAIAYADENLRVAALQAGDVDLIEYLPWRAMEAISGDQKLKLDAVDGPSCVSCSTARGRHSMTPASARPWPMRSSATRSSRPLSSGAARRSSTCRSPRRAIFNPKLKDAWRYDRTLPRRCSPRRPCERVTCTCLSTARYGMHKDAAEVVQQTSPPSASRRRYGCPTRQPACNPAIAARPSQSAATRRIPTTPTGSPTPRRQLAAVLRAQRRRARPADRGAPARRPERVDRAKRKAIYAEMERAAIEEAPMVGLAWRSRVTLCRRT